MNNPYPIPNNQNGILTGLELMGDNIRKSLLYCGKDVVIHPLVKMIRAGNAQLHDACHLLDFCFIDAGEYLNIGKYSILTWFTLIEGGARTTLGDRVFVGPGSKLLTSTYKLHGLYTAEFLPEKFHAIEYGDIVLEDDAYIGANCTVMPGVTIQEGAVVGANSLVNKDLEPWGIYVGSPCKKIGSRQRPADEVRQALFQEIDWSRPI